MKFQVTKRVFFPTEGFSPNETSISFHDTNKLFSVLPWYYQVPNPRFPWSSKFPGETNFTFWFVFATPLPRFQISFSHSQQLGFQWKTGVPNLLATQTTAEFGFVFSQEWRSIPRVHDNYFQCSNFLATQSSSALSSSTQVWEERSVPQSQTSPRTATDILFPQFQITLNQEVIWWTAGMISNSVLHKHQVAPVSGDNFPSKARNNYHQRDEGTRCLWYLNNMDCNHAIVWPLNHLEAS